MGEHLCKNSQDKSALSPKRFPTNPLKPFFSSSRKTQNSLYKDTELAACDGDSSLEKAMRASVRIEVDLEATLKRELGLSATH